MTAMTSLPVPASAEEYLAAAHPDVLRAMLKMFADQLMSAEADAVCGAEYGQVSDDRTNRRNGYRPREWDTRAGTVELAIPKLREGSYFPAWLLERRRRSEQALISVVATCYLLGVSTRRVEKLAQTLGVTQLSKSQVSEMAKTLDARVAEFRNRPLDASPYTFVWADALVMKVREGGRVVNVHVLVAVGVNNDGHREVLGVDIASGEDGAGWLAFFRGLVARGLSRVQLVTSDAHKGLVNAIGATLPGASWQHCRTHYSRNLQAQVSKAAQPWVATLLRTVFEQPDAEAVVAQMARTIDTLAEKFPKAAEHLDAHSADLLAFTAYPKAVWKQVWSNNPQERLNKEIRRRTDVVGIFPDRDSMIRLVGAVLAEQTDEWADQHRYMGLEILADCRRAAATDDTTARDAAMPVLTAGSM
jgi:transposase-like protein